MIKINKTTYKIIFCLLTFNYFSIYSFHTFNPCRLITNFISQTSNRCKSSLENLDTTTVTTSTAAVFCLATTVQIFFLNQKLNNTEKHNTTFSEKQPEDEKYETLFTTKEEKERIEAEILDLQLAHNNLVLLFHKLRNQQNGNTRSNSYTVRKKLKKHS